MDWPVGELCVAASVTTARPWSGELDASVREARERWEAAGETAGEVGRDGTDAASGDANGLKKGGIAMRWR
jgi:hypothetical protein